jgi:uncharacterized membrane protein YeaQ/YmgE (transglycosylase-associated protein family)
MGLMGWLTWLIVGAVAGWLTGIVMKSGGGVVIDIVIGVLGAVIGGVLFSTIGVPGIADFSIWSVFVAFTGAVVMLATIHMLNRRRLTN